MKPKNLGRDDVSTLLFLHTWDLIFVSHSAVSSFSWAQERSLKTRAHHDTQPTSNISQPGEWAGSSHSGVEVTEHLGRTGESQGRCCPSNPQPWCLSETVLRPLGRANTPLPVLYCLIIPRFGCIYHITLMQSYSWEIEAQSLRSGFEKIVNG